MAGNVVEYILKITGGKSKETIKKMAGELKKTQTELIKTGKRGNESFNKIKKSSRNAKKAITQLSGALTKLGIGVGAAAAAFVGMNKVLADSVNEIVDASTRSGIATDTLAGLRLAAEGSGKSFKDLEMGLDSFSKQMLDATKGTGESSKIFKAFGISVTDVNGNLRDSNSVFNETMKKLGQMKNLTQRNAVVMKLFGRSGRALIQSGAIEGLDEFIGKAKELGPALDEEGIQKAAEFQRGMAELKTASIGAIQNILEGLTGEKGIGPALSSLAEDLSNFGGGMKIFLDSMRDAFGGMMIFIDGLSNEISEMTNKLLKFLGISPEQIESKFFGGIISKRGAAEQLLAVGAIEAPETNLEELIDESKRRGATNKKVIKKLILELRKEGSSFKELAQEYQTGNEAVEKIFEFLNKESGVSMKQVKTMFDGYVTQEKKTRKAIQERGLKRLTEKITSGDIKDFEAINNQLINLKEGLQKTGRSTKHIDSLIKKLKKLKEQTKSDIGLDLDLGKGKGKGGAGDGDEGLKEFNKSIDRGLRLIAKYRKEADKLTMKSMKELDESFISLVKKVKEGNITFQEASQEAQILRLKFEDIGLDTTNLDQLIEKIKELKKIEDIKTGISIAADIVGLAGGDILGGVTSLLEKTLKGPALDLLGPASGLVSGVLSFGQGMQQAGKARVEEVERKREEAEIERLEKAFGRSLTDAEKLQAKREARLSKEERAELEEKAMRAKAAADVKQFIMALEIGLQMLPTVLLEVFPPLFIDLAAKIVKALFLLPFRIAQSLAQGVFNVGAKVAEFPLEAIKSIGDLFGIGSKRSGGRFVSARRGLRFTGSQDGLAQLHRNEYVVPESGARPQAVDRIMNQQNGGGVTINVSADIIERDAIEELVRRIERKFQDFGTMQSTLFAG